jgi:Chromo (CHRromatin Organisation MOdifier) domain
LSRTNTNQASVDFAARTQIAIEQAKLCLLQAQEKQKKYADQHRRHIEFEAGQQVLISTKDLPLKGPRRLAPKWYGPVTIIRKLSDVNYQVALPDAWKRKHPVFHIEKLRLFEPSAKFPGRMETRPPPDLDQGSDVYNVESILDRRVTPSGRGFKIEYLVKWEGYPLHEATWEPKYNLADAGTRVQRMIKEIDQAHISTAHTHTTNNVTSEPSEPDDAQEFVPEPAEPGTHNYNLRSKILSAANADALSIAIFSYIFDT